MVNLSLPVVLESLQKLSLFDLYNIGLSIDGELDSRDRISLLRNSLIIGQEIGYVSADENRLIRGVVLEKQQKKVLVKHLCDGKSWWIRYYMINIDDRPLVKIEQKELNQHTVSVGDMMKFDHNGVMIVGQVMKLNPKRVKLVTRNNESWNVYYEHLSPVVDIKTNKNIIDILPA